MTFPGPDLTHMKDSLPAYCQLREKHMFGHEFGKLTLLVGGLGLGLIGAQTFERAFGGLGFARPVFVEEIPGKPGYFLVSEQHNGALSLAYKKDAVWVKETFLKLSVNTGGEMGLLGMAFHPKFTENRKYYINYNPASGGMATVIEERTANETFIRDAGAGKQILRVGQPYNNHNGGTLHFSPKDGFLYIGMGDGGDANDPQGNGQNKNSLLGKMLRIDVDNPADGKAYGIPADNPFVAGGGSKEIFAWGLRNPWQWSFDPLNGDLWAGDVGQDAQEEVDIVIKGGNYGWKQAEGFNNNGAGVTPPVFAYGRSQGRCIIGGRVFRGNASSKYYGQYLVADHEGAILWALKKNGMDRATATQLTRSPGKAAHFGHDQAGNIYVTDLYGNAVYRFAGADWDPAPTSLYPGGRPPEVAPGRLFFAAPGGRLDGALFRLGQGLAVHDGTGALRATLDASLPVLPGHIQAGAYFLRSEGRLVGRLIVSQ